MDAPHQPVGDGMVTALAIGWAALVVVAAAGHRPLAAARLGALGLRPGASTRSHRPGVRPLVKPALAALAAGVVHPLLALAVVVTSLARPWLSRRRAAANNAAAVEAGVADAVALVALGVNAGLNLLGALDAAAAHVDGPAARELARVVAETRRGERLADALEQMATRLGDPVRPLVSALVSCDRYGAAIGPTLDRLGVDVRLASRQRAEAAARRVPVRLLFPLVTCILPAFGLLTVAPLIAGSLSGLGL